MTLINDHECSCADVKCCLCEQDAADGLAEFVIEQAEARREARDRENREHYEARGEW